MSGSDAAEVTNADESIPSHLECAICMKLLLEPVSVPCGHTFCQTCLDQALGYRNLCAVCRAPVPPGQSVNILIRSMISEQYPRALASRRRELEEEVRLAERSAAEERQREVAGDAAVAEANGSAGGDVIILPVLRRAQPMLPQCRIGEELDSQGELLVNFAVQGGRRICVMQPGRDSGICMNVEHLRPAGRQQAAQVTLVGKFRVRLTEPPHLHENGFELGRFEAYFDTPLPLNLLGREASQEGADDEEPAPLIAEAAIQAVERQLEMLGSGSRYVFTESCGEPPAAVRRRPGGTLTSADLEQISFWLLNAIMMTNADRSRWVESTDTHKRLAACRKKLQEAGARPVLNLPGSDSWMHPTQSSWSSLVLLLVVLALLLAKALGVFDSWGRSTSRHTSMQRHRFN